MSSSVTIEELTGRKRRLDLLGTAVPFKGAPWGGENVLPTTFYPGNKRATQQVLAPKLTPSDWQGMWRTPSLLRSPSKWTDGTESDVAYAHQLMEIFESLREEGQLLRVTWATRSPDPTTADQGKIPQRELKMVRIGRMGSFEPKPDTVDDIAWTVNFVWVGKEETPPAIEQVPPDVISLLQQCINADQAVADLPKQKLEPVPTRFSLGQLEQLVDAPFVMLDSFAQAATNAISLMRGLGDLILKVRAIPASLYGRALDVATNAVGTANNFIDQMSRTPKEVLVNRQKVSILSKTAAYYSGAITQAQLMAQLNTNAKLQLARRRSSVQAAAGQGTHTSARDIITVISPKSGDTLASISQRYYGTDFSTALAKANGIAPYAVVPPRGQPLIIPTKTVLELLMTRTT